MRIVSKSLRVRGLLDRVLARPGIVGPRTVDDFASVHAAQRRVRPGGQLEGGEASAPRAVAPILTRAD
ncbi:hypothetical protein HMPREF3159_03865 [Brachybacterium sp. HMSC06H03]|nr:hypothetical protein HMPREF3159_03865 [Brachybacterium sp. HMSC06H03]